MRRVANELAIECELRSKPNLTYTEAADEREQIEDEVEAALRAGLPASLVESCELPFPIEAAVRVEDQAEFHPVRYLAGIAESLGENELFERTTAVSVDAGSPCRVRTEHGPVVTAGDVIVATHMPTLDRGLYFARAHPERSYVVAARAEGTLPGEMYISTEQPAHSIRAHGDSAARGRREPPDRHIGPGAAPRATPRLGARALRDRAGAVVGDAGPDSGRRGAVRRRERSALEEPAGLPLDSASGVSPWAPPPPGSSRS